MFTFSTAMYEVYRDALVQHFECLQDDIDKDIKVISTDSTESSVSVVESLITFYHPKMLK